MALSRFRLVTGYACFRKRSPKPFPDELVKSLTLGSVLDRGIILNGDDALVMTSSFIGVADGVGAWNTKKAGYPGLWATLLVDRCFTLFRASPTSLPIPILQRAYNDVKGILSPKGYRGTTTALIACLNESCLRIANIGDSRLWIIRNGQVVYTNHEQWHWFDCPRQLGTNSPDSPTTDGESANIVLKESDIVLISSDGLSDNLWTHEIVTYLQKGLDTNGPQGAADLLLEKSTQVAKDLYGESPYMERAVMQGLAMEGGKLDDISIGVGKVVSRI